MQHGLWDRLSLEYAIGLVRHKTIPTVRSVDASDHAIGMVLDAGARALIGLGVSACLMASLKGFMLWFERDRLASLTGYVMSSGALGAVLERLADQTIAPDALKSGDVKRIAAFWGAFHTDLANVPAQVLSRACGAWRRSGEKFYPTSGQLLKLCRDDEEWRNATTLRKGLDRIANATPERGDNYRLTDEESMAYFREKLAALGKRVTDERDENAGANADRVREIAITGSLIRRVPTEAA